jgi:alpha-aminoadipate carrier protein LysW
MTPTATQSCPECEASISMPEQVRLSEIIECPDCRSELEIVTLEPVMLALAPEVEEDWGE